MIAALNFFELQVLLAMTACQTTAALRSRQLSAGSSPA
jgi:hypothetical protein